MTARAGFDAAIVGGGILGTATAYHLAAAGARTLLVDRADLGRATDAGAGILSPETNSRDPEPWFDLAVEAAAYYPALIDRLRDEQANDTGYARCGQLVVAVSEDEIEPFARARRLVFERQRRRDPTARDPIRRTTTRSERASRRPAAADPAAAPRLTRVSRRRDSPCFSSRGVRRETRVSHRARFSAFQAPPGAQASRLHPARAGRRRSVPPINRRKTRSCRVAVMGIGSLQIAWRPRPQP